MMSARGLSGLSVLALAALGCHSHNGMRLEAGADLGGSVPEADALPPAASPDAEPDVLPPAASPDAQPDLLSSDTRVESTILGRCTVDDDCLPVLDYRAGFSCWWPVAASRKDMAADPCLVNWWPNAICSTAAPPRTCVGGVGRIPVTHSCIAMDCLWPECREGKCGFAPELPGTRCYGPKSCDSLRAVYRNTLAAAQVCLSWETNPLRCESDLRDTCGCPVAYDTSNRCAPSAVAASSAWRNAGCTEDNCNDACPSATVSTPTCVADPVGTGSTCRM